MVSIFLIEFLLQLHDEEKDQADSLFYVLVWWDPIHTKVQKLFSLEEWDFSLKYIIKVRWDEVSCKFTFWLSELNKRAKMGIKLLLWCLKR